MFATTSTLFLLNLCTSMLLLCRVGEFLVWVAWQSVVLRLTVSSSTIIRRGPANKWDPIRNRCTIELLYLEKEGT